MKTLGKSFLLGVFALQATGVFWFGHLAERCEPERGALCQRGDGHQAGTLASSQQDLSALRHHPACPDKPAPHRHDPQKCSICQFLLTLAAPMEIPPAPPAMDEATSDLPAPSDRPAAGMFLPTLDARGPPACTL